MPKQKKKRAAATSAPYTTSTRTNDTGEDLTVSTESQNGEILHCGVCTTGVDYIVQCERCDTWYCHTCAKVPEQLIELMADCNEAHWFCHKCNDVAIEVISSFGKPESPTVAVFPESYKNVVESITSAFKHLDEVVLDTKKQLQVFAQAFQVVSNENVQVETENTIFPTGSIVGNNLLPNTASSSKTPEDLACKVVDEYRDREKRKLNLIFHNVPESQSSDRTIREAKDKESVLNIAKEIGIKDVEPVSVIRLGSKVSPKGRLIRVQIGSLSIKRALLSNAKKLKNHQSAQLKDVYITPDLSVQERKIQKELRAELKRRKDNGKSN